MGKPNLTDIDYQNSNHKKAYFDGEKLIVYYGDTYDGDSKARVCSNDRGNEFYIEPSASTRKRKKMDKGGAS